MDDCLFGEPLDSDWHIEVTSFLAMVDHGMIKEAEGLAHARRICWEWENQQRIPVGYWLRHDCETRDCIRPDHAIPVRADEKRKPGAPPA